MRTSVTEINVSGEKIQVSVGEPAPGKALFFPSVGEYPVYDAAAYEFMLADHRRNELYSAAIGRHVADRTVLDIGTGADAVWAVASAKAGARRVYSIEVLPEAADQARAAIERAGLAEKVTVIEGMSTEVELPERVDVCVSEIIGTLGGSEGAGAVLRDAWRRHVVDGGRNIPDAAVTTVVAIDLDRASPGGRPVFAKGAERYLERIFATTGYAFDVRLCLPGLGAQAFLSNIAQVEALEFNGELEPEGADHGRLTISSAGRLHGFALGVRLWPDGDDDPLDSLAQQTNWFPVYAPLSESGIAVRPGDVIEFYFTATLSDDRVHPDYELTARVDGAGGPPIMLSWSSPHHGAGFRTGPLHRALFPA